MINVSVVGLGFMGTTHIKAYRKIEGARLAAVCDSLRLPADGDLSNISGNIGAAEPLKLDMTQVKGYKNFEDLLANPDVELVDLCVPTKDHPALAIAALKAGKHVICEKPMARTSALARQMADAAAKSKGFLMPAMCLRFWPEWAWLKNAVEQDLYGKVLAARFRRVTTPPAWGKEFYLKGDESGGALLDMHIHDTDFVQFLFGRPRSVYSTGISQFSGAIDHVVTQYKVDCGATVYAEASWLMCEGHGFNMIYTVNFERATADYNFGRGANALMLYEQGKEPRSVSCEGVDGYVGELQHMIEAIRSGCPPTVVTAQDGVSAVEICEAEEQSVKTGQVVAL